jgi:hypothetical protein
MPTLEIKTQYLTIHDKGKIEVRELATGTHACREILLCEFADLLRLPEKPVQITNRHKDKFIKPILEIIPQILDLSSYYTKGENLEILNKLLLMVVGTLGVCLNHTKEDIEWRLQNCNTLEPFYGMGVNKIIIKRKKYTNYGNNYTEFDVNTFKVTFLTPSYLSNPISASLMIGLIRDCVNLCYIKPKKCNALLKQIDTKELLNVIKDTNVGRAQQIFYNYIIPFILKHMSSSTHNVVKSPKHMKFIEDFIENGFKYFRPEATVMHWCATYDNFGFDGYVKSTL